MTIARATAGSGQVAARLDELQPLLEFCKDGKLFDVQAWIASGKPVNLPRPPGKGTRPRSPLDIAIELGFHSLAQVLLGAGASAENGGLEGPMLRALQKRRLDIIQLLVEHGADPRAIDMRTVFGTWDPAIMEYFIDQGGDVESNRPLAWAFASRIQTALRILKKYRDRFPGFAEQANIALRHHCKEGNLKWVSLLLWAGADPYKPGAGSCEEELDREDSGLSAIGYAALYRHYDVFKLKKIRLDPNHPAMRHVLLYAEGEEGFEIVQELIKNGLNPNDQENGGCSILKHLFFSLDWALRLHSWETRSDGKVDGEYNREKLKAIHLFVRHGARWVPLDKKEISSARRSLLKLTPEYTAEIVWIMSKYRACTKDVIKALLGTPTMKSHIRAQAGRINELIDRWVEAELGAEPVDRKQST